MLGDGIRRNIASVSKEERGRLRDAIIQLQTSKHYRLGVARRALLGKLSIAPAAHARAKTYLTTPDFPSKIEVWKRNLRPFRKL